MLVSAVQFLNAQEPMLVTLSGIVTLVSVVHPEKMLPGIVDTPSGITILAAVLSKDFH